MMILKPSSCSAKPMLKMMWWVPVTHSVPSDLRARRASRNHLTLNSWSFLKPFKRIESLRPLRFRVILGAEGSSKRLEVVRA